MKTWNAPEVKELNINETADGFFDTNVESPWDILLNDSKADKSDKTPQES